VILAVAGVVVLSGVDLAVSGRALAGDALALAGGALVAGYVRVGAEVRRTVANPVYTLGCYGVAGLLLGAACLGSGDDLTGFDARTWWVIVALTAGPQLLGHSVFNRILPDVGPTVVSVAVLLEVVGAALLAWWWFGEVPPAAAIPATALILTGVGLVVIDARAPELTDVPG
jgi:drug/metabolite transporter (DMT)-like permease